MHLGIEIGGTKLQLGIGLPTQATLTTLERLDINASAGAEGILQQIAKTAPAMIERFGVKKVGIGFGGPLDSTTGVITTSHQVAGWDQFPLGDWCQQKLGLPASLGNDCDVATLAEAALGAGKGARSVFYVTVGTGVGGGFVVAGNAPAAGRPAAAEIGHLRPGPLATSTSETVESIASGWGIVDRTRRKIQEAKPENLEQVADLLARCQDQPDNLTGQHVASAAGEGNPLAAGILAHAIRVLGWAVAQVITLQAPEVIVVGGGVSLIGEKEFFEPLREAVAQYVFSPLRGSYQVLPAALGELAVVHGAIIQAGRASTR